MTRVTLFNVSQLALMELKVVCKGSSPSLGDLWCIDGSGSLLSWQGDCYHPFQAVSALHEFTLYLEEGFSRGGG